MEYSLEEKNIKKISEKIYNKYKLCDNCFGRLFTKIDDKLSNIDIGRKLRYNLKIIEEIPSENCWLCQGLLNNKNKYIDVIKKSLIKYEFKSFLIGSIIDEDIIKKEKIILDQYKLKYFESIKIQLNREIGLKLEKILSKNVDFENPQIMIILDTQFNYIKLQIKSIYIYGRYNKLKRGIPQTKWHCKTCRGLGCKLCNYSGKIYEDSVEELISTHALKMFNAKDESFHGAGREDIDVKMLGNGRPFVLEIKNPIKRKIDLYELKKIINTANINKVKLNELKFVDKEEIKLIKTKKYNKTYRVIILGEKFFNIEKLKKAALSLRGKIINQYTPTRVARRRANLIRDRKIYEIDVESVEKKYATLKIRSESGTYIKELITGDNGKTKPSISELIGFPCEVYKLDVINIKE